MTRRKFNQELYNYIKENAKDNNAKELTILVNKKFNETYKPNDIHKYCYRNKIKCKYEMPSMKRNSIYKIPDGTERIHQGMIQIKVNGYWIYKQRYIYEQYYGVKLKSTDYVIFLDQNRNNFNIDNLKVITSKESGYMVNQDLFSKDKLVTETGIIITKLYYKTKEVRNNYN